MAPPMRFPQGLKRLAVNLAGERMLGLTARKCGLGRPAKRARSLRLRVPTADVVQNAGGLPLPHASMHDADFSPCRHTAAPQLRRKFRCFRTDDRDWRARRSRRLLWSGPSLIFRCPFSYPFYCCLLLLIVPTPSYSVRTLTLEGGGNGRQMAPLSDILGCLADPISPVIIIIKTLNVVLTIGVHLGGSLVVAAIRWDTLPRYGVRLSSNRCGRLLELGS